MRKRILIGVVVLLVMFVVGLCSFVATPEGRRLLRTSRNGEETYEGRPADYWVDKLNSTDSKERSNALRAMYVLQPTSPGVVSSLVTIMSQHGDGNTLEEGDPFDAYIALKAILGKKAPNAREAVPVLTKLLHSAGVWKREWAAELLKEVGHDAWDAVPDLREALLKEEYPGAFKYEVEALKAIAPDSVVPVLRRALRSERVGVPGMAADQLGRQEPIARDVLPDLRAVARAHPNEDVREKAAKAVKRIESDTAQPSRDH